jgi:hypothetical protein
MERVGKDAGLRVRIVAMLGVLGAEPAYRRPALATLMQARLVERDGAVLAMVNLALGRLAPTPAELAWLMEPEGEGDTG